jgi:hypothetical protein
MSIDWGKLFLNLAVGALGAGGGLALTGHVGAAGPGAILGAAIAGGNFIQHPDQSLKMADLFQALLPAAQQEANSLISHNARQLGVLTPLVAALSVKALAQPATATTTTTTITDTTPAPNATLNLPLPPSPHVPASGGLPSRTDLLRQQLAETQAELDAQLSLEGAQSIIDGPPSDAPGGNPNMFGGASSR